MLYLYVLCVVCSKLWVRNKPGDEMIDKYNTSTHHGAGEMADVGEFIRTLF